MPIAMAAANPARMANVAWSGEAPNTPAMIVALPMLVSATFAPTDRSKPPETRTIIWASEISSR